MKNPSDERQDRIDWIRARIVARGTKTGRRYDLKMVRCALGHTQAEIAEAACMTQRDVSQLEEAREDISLSMLARYVAALGGSVEVAVVEVAVVVEGRRYVLDLGAARDQR